MQEHERTSRACRRLTSFPVDTTAPNLSVTSPAAGQFFGPTELDSQGRFSVCARTTSADAAGLPASLGAGVNNLCVALGGSTSCVGTAAVAAINTDACVPVTCPGGAPFDITVTLKDGAGNPTTTTIQGVSCASTLAVGADHHARLGRARVQRSVEAHPVGDRAGGRA